MVVVATRFDQGVTHEEIVLRLENCIRVCCNLRSRRPRAIGAGCFVNGLMPVYHMHVAMPALFTQRLSQQFLILVLR